MQNGTAQNGICAPIAALLIAIMIGGCIKFDDSRLDRWGSDADATILDARDSGDAVVFPDVSPPPADATEVTDAPAEVIDEPADEPEVTEGEDAEDEPDAQRDATEDPDTTDAPDTDEPDLDLTDEATVTICWTGGPEDPSLTWFARFCADFTGGCLGENLPLDEWGCHHIVVPRDEACLVLGGVEVNAEGEIVRWLLPWTDHVDVWVDRAPGDYPYSHGLPECGGAAGIYVTLE